MGVGSPQRQPWTGGVVDAGSVPTALSAVSVVVSTLSVLSNGAGVTVGNQWHRRQRPSPFAQFCEVEPLTVHSRRVVLIF